MNTWDKTLVQLIEAYDAALAREVSSEATLEDAQALERARYELSTRLGYLKDERPIHRGWQYMKKPDGTIDRFRPPREAAEIDAERR